MKELVKVLSKKISQHGPIFESKMLLAYKKFMGGQFNKKLSKFGFSIIWK